MVFKGTDSSVIKVDDDFLLNFHNNLISFIITLNIEKSDPLARSNVNFRYLIIMYSLIFKVEALLNLSMVWLQV